MQLERHELPPIGTHCYILKDETTQHAVVFDAPQQAWQACEQRLREEGYSIDALILTHGHWDHMLDAHYFNYAGIPVWAHRDDEAIITDAQVQAAFSIPGIELRPAQVDRWLEPGPLEILGQKAEIRHVPGHCPGNILIYFPELAIAVVGDAIFKRGVGRYDLPGGDEATLMRSIKEQIFTLPPETQLLPGHGPATTVDEESRLNPYVRA
ncbi:MAG: MBL fold metallo-hydrolase [Verrucomicrobiota bacterium JB022]|nr:MBL fold metallo-hydrolase [Verrucomicrobiota bacterium JB022]